MRILLAPVLLAACTAGPPSASSASTSAVATASAAPRSAPSLEIPTSIPPPVVIDPPIVRAVRDAHFGDSRRAMHESVAAFAFWAADGLTMEQLQLLPQTTLPLIREDHDRERGRALCWKGEVLNFHSIELKKDNASPLTFADGLAVVDEIDKHPVRFLAIGSVAQVRVHHDETFCGVFVGKETYANTDRVEIDAVRMVGFFQTAGNVLSRIGTASPTLRAPGSVDSLSSKLPAQIIRTPVKSPAERAKGEMGAP